MPTQCLIQWSHNGIEISEGKISAWIDTTPLSGSSKDHNVQRQQHTIVFLSQLSLLFNCDPTPTHRCRQHPAPHRPWRALPYLPSWWRQDPRRGLHLPTPSQQDPRRELLPLFNHYLRRLLLLQQQQQRPTRRRGRRTVWVTRRGRRRRRNPRRRRSQNPRRRRHHVPKANHSTLLPSPRKE